MIDDTITYKRLGGSDGRLLTELVSLYAEVFETKGFSMPPRAHLQSLLDNEAIIFLVALSGEPVIGGLTAYVLPSVYSPSSQVYIYDLAVRQDRQRQGIGKQLIAILKDHCRQSGHEEIYVQADLEDQHAVDFYRATGGRPEAVIHFSYVLDR